MGTPQEAGVVGHLYVHVPFCVRRCAYCDFTTAATPAGDALMGRYVASVLRLIAQAREAGVLLEDLRTAYIGGGTPSYLGPELLAVLVGVCRATRELSFEANPDSLSDEVLCAAREAGATRVSVGVQSLDDRELGALGRVHRAARAREALGAAVASGLDVSADLMCAIPYQTPQSWEASLRGVAELGVGHVSVYPLQVEEGTALEARCEAGELPWPDEDDEADRMSEAARLLVARGYARYEVASYALAGKACAHNQVYWTGIPYFGVGTAAASMLDAQGYRKLRGIAGSLPALPTDASRVRLSVTSSARELCCARSWDDLEYDFEFLNEREAAAEDLMLGCRMTAGASPQVVARAREVLGCSAVDEAVQAVCARGLARWGADGSLCPTERGWLLGNELYGALWGLARP